MISLDTVMTLMVKVAETQKIKLPKGAMEKQIDDLQSRLQLEIPAELRQWLLVCNAPNLGQGGVFGIFPKEPFRNIEDYYDYSLYWKERGLIPIAGDGCGDYYLLDSSTDLGGSHPVYFVDQQNYDQPEYIVASGLWTFLYFILNEELGADYWPFEKAAVLDADPLLAEYDGCIPFAWDTSTRA